MADHTAPGYLADREKRMAWARKEAELFLAQDLGLVGVPQIKVELLAAKLSAVYLMGANAALLDEVAYLAKAGPRPVRATAPAQRVSEAGEQGESDATGFSGTSEP